MQPLIRTREITLGFGPSPRTTYIYVSRKHNGLWYTWDHQAGDEGTHVNIPEDAITGYVKELEMVSKEYKGKKKFKLKVHFEAEKPYVLFVGGDTVFAKGLIRTLASATPKILALPITIVVEPGTEASVLFCRVYNPINQESIYFPDDEAQLDFRQLFYKAVENVQAAVTYRVDIERREQASRQPTESNGQSKGNLSETYYKEHEDEANPDDEFPF